MSCSNRTWASTVQKKKQVHILSRDVHTISLEWVKNPKCNKIHISVRCSQKEIERKEIYF